MAKEMNREAIIKDLVARGIKPNMDAPTESLERVLRADIEKDKFLVEREYAAGGPIKKKKKTKKKMGHGGKMKKMYAKGGGIRKPAMGGN